MVSFFIYLIRASICLLLFYPFYMVLLSKETFHRFNRIALISIMLVSLLIPIRQISTEENNFITRTYHKWEAWLTQKPTEEVNLTTTIDNQLEDKEIYLYSDSELLPHRENAFASLTRSDYLTLLYIIGIIVLLVRHAYSLYRLTRLLRQGKLEKSALGTSIYLHNQSEIPPFSWHHIIIISAKDYQENGFQIIAHEEAHINNRHSIDLLLAEFCTMIQWFNPIIWLLRAELQDIHEYEADEAVLKQGIDAKQYQLLIIKKAVGARLYSLANSLNHSSLKKRITMMMKEKSNPWARLRYLYVLPVAAVTLVAFARTESTSMEVSVCKVNDLSANKKADTSKNAEKASENMEIPTIPTQNKPEDEVFMVVEKMPEFPGGPKALIKYLGNTICYPKDSQAIEGRVVVEFIVDKDGSICNASIKKSASPELDKEALRVINSMPAWTPGEQRGKKVRVNYTLPIMFKLKREEKKEIITKTVHKDTPLSPINKQDLDQQPQFPGGAEAMTRFITERLEYSDALKLKTEVEVVLVFATITETGEIKEPTFFRESQYPQGIKDEATRVIREMPLWTPAQKDGKAVASVIGIPVVFRFGKARNATIEKVEFKGFSEDNNYAKINLRIKSDDSQYNYEHSISFSQTSDEIKTASYEMK